MKISMIGHSTVLIEINNFRILTDPYLGMRGNLVYKRTRPPACRREDLTDVDMVLVSHNHFDHVDPAFFRLLPEGTSAFAPSQTAWLTRLKGLRSVRGIASWESVVVNKIKITAVPALHSAITRGFILESDDEPTVYFAGDTFYGKFMERVAREFKPEIVLMPVTTFRAPLTMGEKGALAAAGTLVPKVIIPIHLGIQPRSPLIRNKQTPQSFNGRMQAAKLDSRMVLLEEGQSWST